MIKKDAQYWITHLQLIAHPEGGYYRETYRSDMIIPPNAMSETFSGARSISTAIYFLLADSQRSAFHRICSDELWHFHFGESLVIHIITADGELRSVRLGAHIEQGDAFQVTVPANCWFAAEVVGPESFGLCSCTVAPGFDFDDFELADASVLSQMYPQHTALIRRMAEKF